MEKNLLSFGLLAVLALLSGCASYSRSDYSGAGLPPIQPDKPAVAEEVPVSPPEVPTQQEPVSEPTRENLPITPAVTTTEDTPPTPPLSIAVESESEVPIFKDEKINELIHSYNEYIKLAINAIRTKNAQKTKEMEEKLLNLAVEGKGVADKLDETERKAFNDYITKLALQVKAETQKQQ
ncbi:MAG: hypothetical protein LBV12_09445 [Puniceicoccales bacterium]|jgi:hypothetical protein|nr:hypothetical protein [Puniceicoccales bacterium]